VFSRYLLVTPTDHRVLTALLAVGDGGTGLVEAATRVVMRGDEDRWDGVLVHDVQGLQVAGATALLQGLAGAFAIRASHDDLTGLPNWWNFFAQITAACDRTKDDQQAIVADYAHWRDRVIRGLPPFLNVNISRASLGRADLVELLMTTLRRHGVPAQHLRLELIEGHRPRDRAPANSRPRNECVASGCGSCAAPRPSDRGCRREPGLHRRCVALCSA
jgi:hypothetical protein